MELGEDKAGDENKAESSSKVASEKKEEPPTHQLSNPARIVPAQETLVSFPAKSRWQPLRSIPAIAGILVLRDGKPGKTSTPASALNPARYSVADAKHSE